MIVTSLVGALLVALIIWLVNSFSKSSTKSSSFSGTNPYVAKYRGNSVRVPLPPAKEVTGASQGMPNCKFLLSAKSQLQRDYVLIIDRSGSMSTGTRWREACSAVKTLAPYVCKFDPDGISIIFFDNAIEKFDNITSSVQVEKLFESYKPRGSTNLALALHEAFDDHFSGSRGATTILVVTDGAPDSKTEVERILRRAANSVEHLDELSVSFIQIGDDAGASKFLEHLDDTLENVKFDIVDTISSDECRKITFSELVARSIYD